MAIQFESSIIITMTDSIQQQLMQARRDQIIDAAVQVIAEKGFQKTTVRQIAQTAGIADGTIYNYFRNKDAILMGIVARLTEAEVREVHFAEAEQIDLETFISEYFAHRANETAENIDAVRVVFSETMVNQELAQIVFEQIYGPAFAVAEHYFAHLMAIGRLPQGDPAVVSRIASAPLMGLVTLRLLGDPHVIEHWDAHVAAMIEFMLHAYRQGDDPSA